MKASSTGAYVLLTAACNEEGFIERTIESVLTQTQLPARWVIVNDCSTDRTGEIVRRAAEMHELIRPLDIARQSGRDFASKVWALRAGHDLLGDANYQFVGNLDADITLPSDYYAGLLQKFAENPRLGIASGGIHEPVGNTFAERKFNSERSAPHAIQVLRRECYQAIGGFVPLRYGGEDWCAEVTARMKGWEVRSFRDLIAYHHRPTATASGAVCGRFRQGRMDYSVGSDPVFETLKCLRRLGQRPYVVGALARLAGFVSGYLAQEKRPVTADFIRFLRNEQRSRVLDLLTETPPDKAR